MVIFLLCAKWDLNLFYNTEYRAVPLQDTTEWSLSSEDAFCSPHSLDQKRDKLKQ